MSETALDAGNERFGHDAAARELPAASPRRNARLRALAWRLAPWVLPAVLLALWATGCERGWIAPQILPPPERVFDTFVELARSGDLASNTLISLQRVLVGFAAGTLLGLRSARRSACPALSKRMCCRASMRSCRFRCSAGCRFCCCSSASASRSNTF